ncbi:MAG: PD40 domain-containing protein [Armatimonadetes bacterium]|nr:PD40 domain-containing protein [Armatimonadota bacterium]
MRRQLALVAVLAALAVAAVAGTSDHEALAARTKPNPGPRAIVVEWRRDVWQPPEIKTMDVNGANVFTVAGDLWRGGRARWSPDGLRLGGYQKRIGDGPIDFTMMSIRADATDEQVILTGPEFDAFNVARGRTSLASSGNFSGSPFGVAAWSPDGDFLVFAGRVRYPDPDGGPYDIVPYRIFTVSLDGTKTITALTDEAAEYDDLDPHWSAQGKIVFVSGRAGPQQELFAINPDGTGLQQMTTFGQTGLPSGTGQLLAAPVWSHSGARIALSGGHNPGCCDYSGDLWVLDLDGNLNVTAATVVRGLQGVMEWEPAWSPEDGRLIFTRWRPVNSRQDEHQIVIVNLTTNAEPVIVDQTKQAVLHPDWNPVEPVP